MVNSLKKHQRFDSVIMKKLLKSKIQLFKKEVNLNPNHIS
jgi:hypothetical protein